jgi:hypothetical protein
MASPRAVVVVVAAGVWVVVVRAVVDEAVLPLLQCQAPMGLRSSSQGSSLAVCPHSRRPARVSPSRISALAALTHTDCDRSSRRIDTS